MSQDIVERLRYYADLAIAVAEECEAMTQAADEIERLRSAQAGWQPISTAPVDGTDVLLWEEDCRAAFMGYYDSGKWVDRVFDRDIPKAYEFTHWMPLPEAPE